MEKTSKVTETKSTTTETAQPVQSKPQRKRRLSNNSKSAIATVAGVLVLGLVTAVVVESENRKFDNFLTDFARKEVVISEPKDCLHTSPEHREHNREHNNYTPRYHYSDPSTTYQSDTQQQSSNQQSPQQQQYIAPPQQAPYTNQRNNSQTYPNPRQQLRSQQTIQPRVAVVAPPPTVAVVVAPHHFLGSVRTHVAVVVGFGPKVVADAVHGIEHVGRWAFHVIFPPTHVFHIKREWHETARPKNKEHKTVSAKNSATTQ
jgi:hypothetical protein